MKTAIGVYNNHEAALKTVVELKNAGYPVKHISIMGKTETEVFDNEMHITPKNPLRIEGLAIGVLVGTTLGTLVGVGVFSIPGLGILFGAGAVVGAIAGIDFGLISGGLASILLTIGLHDESIKKYQQYLEEGRYLLVVKGTNEEAERAMKILTEHGTYIDLIAHRLVLNADSQEAERRERNYQAFLNSLETQFPLSSGERDII